MRAKREKAELGNWSTSTHCDRRGCDHPSHYAISSERPPRVLGHDKNTPCPKCGARAYCKDCDVCTSCGHTVKPD